MYIYKSTRYKSTTFFEHYTQLGRPFRIHNQKLPVVQPNDEKAVT